MDSELNFSPDEATLKNLAELSGRLSVLSEERMLELHELADTLLDTVFSDLTDLEPYTLFSLLHDGILTGDLNVHTFALEENFPRIRSVLLSVALSERSVLTDLLIGGIRRRGLMVNEHDFLLCGTPDEIVAYVKNSFSDEAYDVFSEQLDDPRVRYAKSFKDAVRMLSDGEVGYALLPLEERGIRIPTVEELIWRADLKIAAITPVFGQDGEVNLKYALISKTLVTSAVSDLDDRYLEIRLSKGMTDSLLGIMMASVLFELEIYRINTIAFGRDEDKSEMYSIIFRGEGCDFSSMLAYLTLFTDDFSPVGIYKNLE